MQTIAARAGKSKFVKMDQYVRRGLRMRICQLAIVCMFFPLSCFANCYVLQNNTDAAQTLRFQYSKPLPGAKTDLSLAPHARFPRTAQLCFNTPADTYATVSIDPPATAAGAYAPSWQGTLVIGNGSN